MKNLKTVICSVCAACLFCHSFSLYAGPWFVPSEAWESSATLSSKSDVALLAHYGLIKAPILTWPLAWTDIGPSLLSSTAKKRIKKAPFAVQLAYGRILSQYYTAIEQQKIKPSAYVSGGQHINPFRTIDYQPRANFQGGVALEGQNKHLAIKAAVDYGEYDDATLNAHVDDSYAYLLFGNWALGFDKLNNWWGPGYSSSMIYSSNPPPLAKFTFRRNQSLPFETKWLSWIGHWSITTSLSRGGPNVPEPYPLIWMLNLAARPLQSLQLSLSRNSLFAGEKRPVNWTMIGNLITADDNCDPSIYGQEYCARNTPGNEIWELTGDWDWYQTFKIPANLYLQTTFNDRIPSNSYMWVYNAWHAIFPKLNPPIPARTAFLAGASTWGSMYDQLLRLYFEFEYTHQYAYYFWGEREYDIYGGSYPYVYYGKLIGSTLGSDATGYTVGAILNETNGNTDSILIRYVKLNQVGTYNQILNWGYPFHKQDLLWLSFNRSVDLTKNLGRLSGQLGYIQSLNGSGLKTSPSFYLVWTKGF
ncbi:MAG: hypothetical protein A3F18_02860 [Legionellales bacterium RIFCSPHIGHO2_12_FULL_37_14]|nr:MAG: hypothetical protein A3F18_02860 [Legionellales bacterium RIFCSPHIGHO2_12_FULL_37_14]